MTPAEVLAAVGDRPAPPQAARPAPELLAASGADVLVELTVMGDLSGVAAGATRYTPAATGHVLEAFRLGMDVVTADKGPIAWSWPEVSAAAAASGRRVRFESTVMDGLPVFSLLEFALPDCRLLGFEAVFNATTNFIIDAMGTGRSYESALAQVQAEGYAEADPSNDVDGWDAASKAAALANVAMGAGITPRGRGAREPARRAARADAAARAGRPASAPGHERLARVGRPGQASSPARRRVVRRPRPRPPARRGTRHRAPAGGAVAASRWGAVLHTDLMADVLVSEPDYALRCRRPPTACTPTCCIVCRTSRLAHPAAGGARRYAGGRCRRAGAPHPGHDRERRHAPASPAFLAARPADLARDHRRRQRARRRSVSLRAHVLRPAAGHRATTGGWRVSQATGQTPPRTDRPGAQRLPGCWSRTRRRLRSAYLDLAAGGHPGCSAPLPRAAHRPGIPPIAAASYAVVGRRPPRQAKVTAAQAGAYDAQTRPALDQVEQVRLGALR